MAEAWRMGLGNCFAAPIVPAGHLPFPFPLPIFDSRTIFLVLIKLQRSSTEAGSYIDFTFV